MAGTNYLQLPAPNIDPSAPDNPAATAAPSADQSTMTAGAQQFQQQFGMTPQQWFAQNPDYYQPNSSTWNSPQMQLLNSSGYFNALSDSNNAGGAGGSGVPQPDFTTTAPAPISAFGPTPSVTPTYAQAPSAPNAAQMQATNVTAPTTPGAATVDPNQNNAYLTQYSNLLATSLAPQFQAQQQTLQDQAAARGLTGGAAQYGEDQLLGQQASALAAGTQPIVSQAYGYTQQDIQGNQAAQNALISQGYSAQEAAAMANASAANSASSQNQAAINALMAQGYSYEQATTQANQAAANNASSTNAAYYGGALSADYTSYNNYLNSLMTGGANNYNNLQGTYLNSYAPNAGVTGSLGNAANEVGSAYSSANNAATQGQGAAVGGLFGAAGTAAAGGAFGGPAAAGG